MSTIAHFADTEFRVQRIAEFFSFHLGKAEYGVDILTMQEIRGFDTPRCIANAPEYKKWHSSARRNRSNHRLAHYVQARHGK